MVRKPPFIEYFIIRKNMLPRMGQEIEHIIANKRGLRATGLLRVRGWNTTTWIQGTPVLYIYFPTAGRIFQIKRRDTGKHEDWLGDYLEFPDLDWHLMAVLNQERANRAAALRRALE